MKVRIGAGSAGSSLLSGWRVMISNLVNLLARKTLRSSRRYLL
jgi:hypothetical protein